MWPGLRVRLHAVISVERFAHDSKIAQIRWRTGNQRKPHAIERPAARTAQPCPKESR